MKTIGLSLMIVLALPLLAMGQVYAPPQAAPSVNAVVPGTTEVNVSATVSATDSILNAIKSTANGKRKLTWRERRKLGFTRDNIARVRMELIQSGFIDADTPSSEYNDMVVGIILVEADPDVRAEIVGTTSQQLGEIDWDNLARIIEMILEFLSKILPMFLSPTPIG